MFIIPYVRDLSMLNTVHVSEINASQLSSCTHLTQHVWLFLLNVMAWVKVITKHLSVTEWCLWCFRIRKCSCIQCMNMPKLWFMSIDFVWKMKCYLWMCTCCDMYHSKWTMSCYKYTFFSFALKITSIISDTWQCNKN